MLSDKKDIKDIVSYFNNISVDAKSKILQSERVDNIKIIKDIVDKSSDIRLIFKLYHSIYISDNFNYCNKIFNDKLKEIFKDPNSNFYDYIFNSNYPNIIYDVFPSILTNNSDFKLLIVNSIMYNLKHGRSITNIKHSFKLLTRYNNIFIGDILKQVFKYSNKDEKSRYIEYLLNTSPRNRSTYILNILPLFFNDIDKYGFKDKYIQSYIFVIAINIDFLDNIDKDIFKNLFKEYPQYMYKLLEMYYLYNNNSIYYNTMNKNIMKQFDTIIDVYNYDILLITLKEYDCNFKRVIENVKNNNNIFKEIESNKKLEYEILKEYKQQKTINIINFEQYIAFQHIKDFIIVNKLQSMKKDITNNIDINN